MYVAFQVQPIQPLAQMIQHVLELPPSAPHDNGISSVRPVNAELPDIHNSLFNLFQSGCFNVKRTNAVCTWC